jgi:hypothetical protein
MKTSIYTTVLLLLVVFLALVATLPTKTSLAGSHTMYKFRNGSGAGYGDEYFCEKCHPSIAGNVSGSSAHNNTACICHGYYPNYTKIAGPYGEGGDVSINLEHNLTKDIYCTNCHARYNDTTGGIDIGNNQDGRNQSAHYIYLNRSNTTEIYNRAWRYFNRSFGPLG